MKKVLISSIQCGEIDAEIFVNRTTKNFVSAGSRDKILNLNQGEILEYRAARLAGLIFDEWKRISPIRRMESLYEKFESTADESVRREAFDLLITLIPLSIKEDRELEDIWAEMAIRVNLRA